VTGRTALDNYTVANPNCEVCAGTGVDPIFESTCTMCWPVRRAGHARLNEHLHPTLPQMVRSAFIDAHVEVLVDRYRRNKARAEHQRWMRRARFKRDHPILMRIITGNR
jgi:hypothetical protein